MAAALSDAFSVDAELIKGEKGVFDVVVDGDLVYSKHETGRFPENDEIIRLEEVFKIFGVAFFLHVLRSNNGRVMFSFTP